MFVPLLLLLALGVAFMVAEHALPTAGILGIFAAGCYLLGLYWAFSESIGLGLRYLAAEAVIVPTAYFGWAHVISRTKFGRATSLRPPDGDEMDVSHAGSDLGRLVGERGRALTTLRPSGMVDFEGRRLDGVAEEGLIPVGSSVLAVRVASGRLVVRADPAQ